MWFARITKQVNRAFQLFLSECPCFTWKRPWLLSLQMVVPPRVDQVVVLTFSVMMLLHAALYQRHSFKHKTRQLYWPIYFRIQTLWHDWALHFCRHDGPVHGSVLWWGERYGDLWGWLLGVQAHMACSLFALVLGYESIQSHQGRDQADGEGSCVSLLFSLSVSRHLTGISGFWFLRLNVLLEPCV